MRPDHGRHLGNRQPRFCRLQQYRDADVPGQRKPLRRRRYRGLYGAETDLDEIAATLLSEYQKEAPAVAPAPATEVELPKSEDNTNVAPSNEQFSSVFVTPNSLPNEEKVADIPSLNDIPAPQPVRVVNQSTIIDSSKKDNVNVNNIEAETYNLNK